MDYKTLRQRQFSALLAEMSCDERECALRTAAEHTDTSGRPTETSYAPPDPYAAGLSSLRAAMEPRAAWPQVQATALPLDRNGVPDPYARDIKALREKEGRP